MTEYGIFALLLWRAIYQSGTGVRKPRIWQEAAIVLVLVFLYSATDEYHQSFVPTRTPLFSDCLIDTTGGALALILGWSLQKCLKKSRS